MDLDDKMQAKMHARFAELLWEMLHAEPCEHCKRSFPGAKEMTVVRQFLADNGTTADLRNAAPLHNLADALPSFDEEEKVTKPGKAKKRTA
jgi:hypothetical protein